MTLPDLPRGARVIAVGIDVVAVDRFASSLQRTPGLAGRLFSAQEQLTATGHHRGPASLAARFAVKESVAKALGAPSGLDWHDCRVLSELTGRPVLQVVGTVAAAAASMGVTQWRLSVSHDAGIAAAVVVALG